MISQAQVTDGTNMLRQLQFPAGALITMEDLQDAGREHVLDRLREQEPVTWLPALGGWLITSREGAREMLLPKAGATVEVSENMVRASLGKMMLTVDAPAHDQLIAQHAGGENDVAFTVDTVCGFNSVWLWCLHRASGGLPCFM